MCPPSSFCSLSLVALVPLLFSSLHFSLSLEVTPLALALLCKRNRQRTRANEGERDGDEDEDWSAARAILFLFPSASFLFVSSSWTTSRYWAAFMSSTTTLWESVLESVDLPACHRDLGELFDNWQVQHPELEGRGVLLRLISLRAVI